MSSPRPPDTSDSPVADLHPASFAIVMATGIVSVAAQLRGMPAIALALLWLNVVFYIALWGLMALRISRYGDRFIADLFDHNRCVGFFAIVAGTCVLGNQFIIVSDHPRIALGLFVAGILLWLVVTYTVFTILTIKRDKPALADGINGGWLVSVVAAQSVAVLAGSLVPQVGFAKEQMIFFALVMWLGGGMLYIWIIALIFYRYTFLLLDPRQLAPPYWINMGAMAISTLAGTVIGGLANDSQLVLELLPFVKGLTLLFWATATWWIPLLILLGIWRHMIRSIPLTYDIVYWSAVFPLGMYTVCTHRLARLIDTPFLDVFARYFVFIALAAWVLTFVGLLRRLTRIQ